jgi:DsbC/DsbD-like thiol-disulfide interchange protein
MNLAALLVLSVTCAAAAQADGWTEAVEVRHDDKLCVSYQAKRDGPYLVVRAALEPGWHTFAMDNKKRAEEKLAGKPSLGIDHPTEISLAGGLETVGPWYQTPPKDFSRPELRWFSWGYERQALFVAKIRRSGAAPSRIAIRGQACTDQLCKNIDISISLPPGKATAPEIDVKNLVQVR